MLAHRDRRPGARDLRRPTTSTFIVLVVVLALPPPPPAAAQTTVPAQANIYGAGHDSPPAPGGGGAGVSPTLVTLPSAADRTVTFTGVAGTIDYGPCCPPNGPDGVAVSDAYPAPIWDGLAGTDFPTRSRFLAGVFLDDTEPGDPAPERLFFADGAFADLSPSLRQIFFVGDGLTGTGDGEAQVFHVPAGATRLFLGLQDRFSTDPNVPGYYGDNSGLVELTVTVQGDPTAARDVATAPRLWQNAPNPFNPATTIRFEVPAGGGRATVAVHDLRGRRVRLLLDAERDAGPHAIRWDGTDDRGGRLPAGAYCCRLVTPQGAASIKLTILP